jgi:two-component system, NtrC family, sensor kinase
MLSRRLILFIAIPLVCSMVAGGVMLEHFMAKRFERRMEAEVEMVARALKIPVGHAVKVNREGAIERALESINQIGRVYSADVYDENGELLATTRGPGEDLDPDQISRLEEAVEHDGRYEQVDGREVYSHFVTLSGLDGRPSGFLQVTRLKSDFRQFVADLRSRAARYLVGTIVAMLVIVSLGYYGAAGKALSALQRSIRRVRDGERDHRADIFGPKEVALIARSFNEMLDTIAAAEAEIAEQRRQQSALEEQLRRSERLAALGRLSGGVAHELGTPLSTISGRASQALRMRQEVPEVCVRNLEVIERETGRMERIVRELLDFGRMGGGTRRRISVEALVNTALKAVDDEIQGAGTEVRFDPSREPVNLDVDPARFERALTNLISNASQAAGGGEVVIGWCTTDDRRLVLWIDDDGEGIDPVDRQRIFEPFFTTKRAEGGTGLGLSIVHAIVTEHGGTVSAGESDELRGARMKLVLPLDAPKDLPGPNPNTSSLVQWI